MSTSANPAGKAGAPLAPVCRRGSLLDAEALMTGRSSKAATSAMTSRKGNAPNAAASSDSDGAELLDSRSIDSAAAATAAASKPPRPCKGTQPAEGQKRLPAEAGFMQSLRQQQQPWMQLNEHSSAVAESADTCTAQPGQTNSKDGAASPVGTTPQAVRSQSSIPFAVAPGVRLPHERSTLKSAASVYAESGVVDDLFTPKDTYVGGDAAYMTKARHHFGLSSEQVAADIKKQKEFAGSLAAWYKSQFKGHARMNASGGRIMSRSNSTISD